jgi:hypothetical protein
MDDLKKENEKMAVLHTVMPSPDKNKDEYASYYILIEDRILLSEGVFSTFPYSVSGMDRLSSFRVYQSVQ